MEITCKSIIVALDNNKHLNVEVQIGCYVEDKSVVPENFSKILLLKESIHDHLKTTDNRKLPVLRELLTKTFESSTADYIIYSNPDIAIMPYFYHVIENWIKKGHDSLIINRRRIAKRFLNEADLQIHYAEAGKAHPGFDCFIFKRELIPKLELENVCIGVPHAENLLAHNLFIKTNNCLLVTDAHLTYHIGLVLHNNWADKTIINWQKKQFIGRLKKMRKAIKIENFPGAEMSFFKRHYKWLMNPSFHYPTMFKYDFKQWKNPRRVKTKNEKQDRKNRYFERLIKRINFD
jgi:hypothetical protein